MRVVGGGGLRIRAMQLMSCAMKWSVIGLLASIAFTPVSGSARSGATIDAARAVLVHSLSQDHVPGASVAVRRHGKLVWSEAFGFADVELKVRASTSTRFRLASVSKPITAALAVRLSDQGLLTLDEPICNYAADLPPQHCKTTLDNLLGHRGGVRHYQDKDYDIGVAGTTRHAHLSGRALQACGIHQRSSCRAARYTHILFDVRVRIGRLHYGASNAP